MSGLSQPYELPGNSKGNIDVQFVPQSVGITNRGSTWLHFPQVTGALGWVAPRQFSAIIPAPTSYMGAITVDSTTVPSSAYLVDNSDLTPADITVFEDWFPPSVGVSLLSQFPQQAIQTSSTDALAPTTYAFHAESVSSGALGAGGDVVMLSIWHQVNGFGNPTIRTPRLKRLYVSFDSISAATILTLRLIRFTGTTLPGAGGALITPSPLDTDPSIPVAETKIRTLPAPVGGAESGIPVAYKRLPYGIIAGSVSDLYRDALPLYEQHLFEQSHTPNVSLGSTLQPGWNLHLTSSIAATIVMNIWGYFTET